MAAVKTRSGAPGVLFFGKYWSSDVQPNLRLPQDHRLLEPFCRPDHREVCAEVLAGSLEHRVSAAVLRWIEPRDAAGLIVVEFTVRCARDELLQRHPLQRQRYGVGILLQVVIERDDALHRVAQQSDVSRRSGHVLMNPVPAVAEHNAYVGPAQCAPDAVRNHEIVRL